MKEAQTQLSQRLADAAQKVTVGAHYMHYKQLSYTVIALALIEETLEPCVVYQANYSDHITYTRPLTSWLETVELNGQKVQRFTKL